MRLLLIILLVVTIKKTDSQNNKLPEDFLVGFGASAYQVEGAWNEDGKGENTWDHFIHNNPEVISDRSNGDIAADQYHKYREDIAYLKQIGAQTYRISLSWSRILPDGQPTNINLKGVDYYNKLIDGLLENNIIPMVTIFCWDLPQRLQDLGGWPNPIMADYYEDYARIVFSLFGDRVKYWMTFNEPFETCYSSYGSSEKAPGINMSGIADYLCAHTLIYAHARAYHLYDDSFRPTQKGSIGIILSGGWNEPASDKPEDIAAAEVANAFQIGWFADPIFSKTGDYPEIMRKNVDANSADEGRLRSRLPQWDAATIQYIQGTSDFYGLNHYTTTLSSPLNPAEGPVLSWDRDCGVNSTQNPSWPTSASSWLRVVPYGIRRTLNYIKEKYNNPTLMITENGFSDLGELEDNGRINYHFLYLQEVLNAIYQDGCNVVGYSAWTLTDNFEWAKGYQERFGIIHVDFTSPNRTRTLKKSASFFQQLIASRELPPQ